MKKIETNIKEKKYLEESIVAEKPYDISVEWNIIECYPKETRQIWLGAGGAITESSAYNYSLLSDEKQDEFLNAYYQGGLNYNFGRISIASNDFCLSSYEYTAKNDLSDFTIEQDKKYLLPFLKKIKEKTSLTFIASPWSPPSIWKEKNDLYHGAKLKKDYYRNYAKYLRMFLEEYEKEGISISYLTMQNEPLASQSWESCVFSLQEQQEFIYDYLLKEIEEKDVSILLWDHNKENLVRVADALVREDKKIKGIAFHNYTGIHSANVSFVREKYPNILLVQTEGCCGFSGYKEKKWISDAEYYLISLISDMKCGLNAYLDWNILLDSHGGPSHKENYCKSPIILNKKKNDFIKTPIYYYLAHVTKYIRPGYYIIPTSVFHKDLLAVSAVSESEVVTVILNPTSENLEFHFVIEEQFIKDKICAHSIITYISERK